MAVQSKSFSPEEIAFGIVMRHPVLLYEFLNNTNWGSLDRKSWPSRKFRMTWYQKDLNVDDTAHILYEGGRAIGKCEPSWARLYTYPYGYMTITDIQRTLLRGPKNPFFLLYCLDENKQLRVARATLEFNATEPVYSVTTESGFVFDGSANHPILTPAGYVPLADLLPGAEVAVVSKLPHESNCNSLTWYELRWLGYVFGAPHVSGEAIIRINKQAQRAELEKIATYLGSDFFVNPQGNVTLKRKRGPAKHPGNLLLREIQATQARQSGLQRIPKTVKEQRLENLKVLLESFLSINAKIDQGAGEISFRLYYQRAARDFQELFLRFGIETIVSENGPMEYTVTTRAYQDYYKILMGFKIPGVAVASLPPPKESTDGHLRYEKIVCREELPPTNTYAVSVHEFENYISGNLYVHNSITLAAKRIWTIVNPDLAFSETTSAAMMTPNNTFRNELVIKNVMRPIMGSTFLSSFMAGQRKQMSQSEFIIDFYQSKNRATTLQARIVGVDDEKNQSGLHVPDIVIDEGGMYPYAAYQKLRYALNRFEDRRRFWVAGVHNNSPDGVLHALSRGGKQFKKYRIPSPNNPYYSLADLKSDIEACGGVDTTLFKNTVLAQLGPDEESPIPFDSLLLEDFMLYKQKVNGRYVIPESDPSSFIDFYDIPEHDSCAFSVDLGFSEPTIIHVYTYHEEDRKWRLRVRYQLNWVGTREIAEVINYLAGKYKPSSIAIDLGPAGQGQSVLQHLIDRRNFGANAKRYEKIIKGVTWKPHDRGTDIDGNELRADTKSVAGDMLVGLIVSGRLVLSQLDKEGQEQITRMSFTKRINGSKEYFVRGKYGTGRTKNDHIFASLIVFAFCVDAIPRRHVGGGAKPRRSMIVGRSQ